MRIHGSGPWLAPAVVLILRLASGTPHAAEAPAGGSLVLGPEQ